MNIVDKNAGHCYAVGRQKEKKMDRIVNSLETSEF